MGKHKDFTAAYLTFWDIFKATEHAGIKCSQKPGRTYYVYCLVRMDNNQIVYVGKGKGRRMHQHMKDVRNGHVSGVKKYRGLSRLNDKGVNVVPYVVFDGLPESEAYDIEAGIISDLEPYLLNSQYLYITGNQKLIAEAEALIRKISPHDDCTTSQYRARRWAVSVLHNYIDEVTISEAIGYQHNDWWDGNRMVARQEYINNNKPPRRSLNKPLDLERALAT